MKIEFRESPGYVNGPRDLYLDGYFVAQVWDSTAKDRVRLFMAKHADLLSSLRQAQAELASWELECGPPLTCSDHEATVRDQERLIEAQRREIDDHCQASAKYAAEARELRGQLEKSKADTLAIADRNRSLRDELYEAGARLEDYGQGIEALRQTIERTTEGLVRTLNGSRNLYPADPH
jgi:chromosome segregation ATPase